MPIAPRMNNPVGPYDFWRDTLQPGLLGLYDRWTEQKPWPTPEQINAAVQNPGLLDREAMAGYAVDMAQPFAAKLGGLLGHMPIPEGGLFGITTWHGSPHKWTRPDISKVGTGEGAQAYGHGFYSAEARDVADQYRINLSYNPVEMKINGKPIAKYYDDLTRKADRLADPGDLYEKAGIIERLMANEPADQVQSWANGMGLGDWFEKEIRPQFETYGNLYKLDIPDEDVARYLDWDKPLSEQGEDIRNLAKAVGLPEEIDGHGLLGRALYEHIAQSNIKGFKPSQDIASEMLLEAGIPGIRYLDGSSRSAGEGTYNYVTFDPSRIKVLERNGEDLRGLLGMPQNQVMSDQHFFVDWGASKEVVQDQAENVASRLRSLGYDVSLQHSGSRAGASSYLSIADPETGRFLNNVRVSGHSKGPKMSEHVVDIRTEDDFLEIVSALAAMRNLGKSQGLLYQEQLESMAQQLIADGVKPRAAYKKARDLLD